ncbi:MAG TPA: hypothetical protein PLE59_00870 [Bacteroidales bacterium]|nr:hypothetical protein [Bacteroidales bacterium]
MSNYIVNITEIKSLLISFEHIDKSINYDQDFSKVLISRNNQEYETVMNWSKVFLYNKSFTTFSGTTTARAILFPMEKVFEAYVASELIKNCRNMPWDITTQDKGFYLFDEPMKFSLRPDIIVKKTDGTVIVIDTKWKVLVDDERKNYGISQSDMYQMYAYAKKYNSQKVLIIYPNDLEMSKYLEDGIQFKSEGVLFKIVLFELDNVENSVLRIRREI